MAGVKAHWRLPQSAADEAMKAPLLHHVDLEYSKEDKAKKENQKKLLLRFSLIALVHAVLICILYDYGVPKLRVRDTYGIEYYIRNSWNLHYLKRSHDLIVIVHSPRRVLDAADNDWNEKYLSEIQRFRVTLREIYDLPHPQLKIAFAFQNDRPKGTCQIELYNTQSQTSTTFDCSKPSGDSGLSPDGHFKNSYWNYQGPFHALTYSGDQVDEHIAKYPERPLLVRYGFHGCEYAEVMDPFLNAAVEVLTKKSNDYPTTFIQIQIARLYCDDGGGGTEQHCSDQHVGCPDTRLYYHGLVLPFFGDWLHTTASLISFLCLHVYLLDMLLEQPQIQSALQQELIRPKKTLSSPYM